MQGLASRASCVGGRIPWRRRRVASETGASSVGSGALCGSVPPGGSGAGGRAGALPGDGSPGGRGSPTTLRGAIFVAFFSYAEVFSLYKLKIAFVLHICAHFCICLLISFAVDPT